MRDSTADEGHGAGRAGGGDGGGGKGRETMIVLCVAIAHLNEWFLYLRPHYTSEAWIGRKRYLSLDI